MLNDCRRRIQRGRWAEDLALERCDLPIGPRNTFSNLAYLIPAAVAWPDSPVLTFACVFLTITSAIYHAVKTPISNRWDRAGMGVVFGTLMAIGIQSPDLLQLAVAAFFGFFCYRLSLLMDMSVLMAVLGLPPLLAVLWRTPFMGYLAIGAFVLAYTAWLLDRHGSRLIGLWGHALWHVLTGTGIAILARALLL